MYDAFNRKIDYLRISVTDRCNLRCVYCMPEEGVAPLRHKDILRFEEIQDLVRIAVEGGVSKVRLTGGEPLVRKGIVAGVRLIAALEGIKDLCMTTNGILLEKFAQPLKEAGLMRVNVSLDTLSPERFRTISRGGDLDAVLRGIDAAVQVGLSPLKLNCVIADSPEERDARLVSAYAKEHGFEIRYIKKMDLKAGQFQQVIGGSGGNCATCNRLRLTSNGDIRPCLFSDLAFNVRQLGAREAFRQALAAKPRSGGVVSTPL